MLLPVQEREEIKKLSHLLKNTNMTNVAIQSPSDTTTDQTGKYPTCSERIFGETLPSKIMQNSQITLFTYSVIPEGAKLEVLVWFSNMSIFGSSKAYQDTEKSQV